MAPSWELPVCEIKEREQVKDTCDCLFGWYVASRCHMFVAPVEERSDTREIKSKPEWKILSPEFEHRKPQTLN